MTTHALSALLAEVRALHETTPALSEFAPWPADLVPAGREPAPVPAVALIETLPATTTLVAAIRQAAAFAEWRQTYSEAEVGADFLARYGYFELYGPEGHYRTNQLRGYIAFWGEGLDYGWHHHAAEELYFGILGSPVFLSKAQASACLAPGGTRRHAPWEVHAMRITDTAFLCYAVWKGAGLADLPAMEAAH